MAALIRRFRCEVPQSEIDDLNRRLDTVRLPDDLIDVGWDYGTPSSFVRALADHWRHRFDWRSAEAKINAFDQFKIEIDALDTHFIHQRSPHANAIPLLITHGWPGSVVEFLEVIPRLVEPERFGGRAEDAFHVVAPSLPGYGFSEASSVPGMSPRAIAARHLKLMSALGYERFVAQGGDWGSIISRFLPDLAGERLIGLHLNMMPPWKPTGTDDPFALMTDNERTRYHSDRARIADEFGYQSIQKSRPQSLAYGLSDSPIGLAAWIVEKFHAWTDHGGEVTDALSFDQMLTNISLYWFTGTIASSVRLYREYELALRRGERPLPRVDVPTGGAFYPREIFGPVKAWVEREYNLVHWYEAPAGGHFAALEQPALFAADLLAFGRTVRTLAAD